MAPSPQMEVRGSRSSTIFIHRVPAEKAERFMELQRSITRAVEGFAGFQGTEVYPPAAPQGVEWVTVIHFDKPADLQYWLDSAVRAEWIAKIRGEIGEFRLKTLPGGFGPWFAEEAQEKGGLPPSWKMALTVLVGLYPTVMLLQIFVGPHTSPLGLALSVLIGNAVSVCILQWGVMPVLNAMLRPWVRANAAEERALSLGGLALLLVVLGVMAALFRLATG
jgi:antibiotic biosynthesis monooxygenase (ABM) superfamily enzyme